MKEINRSALVPFSASQMFRLVDAIDLYPEFLPWCVDAQIHSRERNEVKATIELKKAGLHKSFSTLNLNTPGEEIEMRLLEGPFKQLQGHWRFQPLNETACKVTLDIEFEFSSRVLSMVVGPVFSQVANSLVDSFQKRAVDVYGKR